MRRKLVQLLCCLIVLLSIPSVAKADMGPKTSIEISFTGLEGERYYTALLVKPPVQEDMFTPSLLRDSLDTAYTENAEEAAIFQKIALYQDADGYAALNRVEDCSKSHLLDLSRFSVPEFKILLYFPETDHFVESNRSYQSYAFNSYFAVHAEQCGLSSDSQGELDLKLQNTYHYGRMVLAFFVQVAITLLIEIGIARLFQLRQKKVFRFIVLVNLVTQVLLNVVLYWLNYQVGLFSMAVNYFGLEILVFLLEAVLYAIYFSRLEDVSIDGWKPWVYSLVANAASFLVGLQLAAYLTLK
jgi:hypothetical protein